MMRHVRHRLTPRALLLFGAACSSLACQSLLPAPVPPPLQPPPIATASSFRVGVSRVDITPPPGVSTFGHGPDALVAEGYWTRIYCRVFFIEAADGRQIALVPCDLPASSTIVQRSVAAAVQDYARAHQGQPALSSTRIFMSATHTHAGPAHYFDGLGLSGTESSHMPGYDPQMVHFLARKVAKGIVEASVRARDATLRSWHYERGEACPNDACGTWGIAWNRSLDAHRLNPPIEENAPSGLCPAERAIDPSMHVLRFEEAGGAHRPIGELVSFAMHPTVLPNTNRLIGADTAGVLSRLRESELRAAGGFVGVGPGEPLVGVINTNEGDMSPKWTLGTKAEAVEVATRLADRVRALTATPAEPQRQVLIDARYLEADVLDQVLPGGARTCKTPELGESVPFGACDHPASGATSLPPPSRAHDARCQSPKLDPGGRLEELLSGGTATFETRLPLGLVRIGDSAISYVPAELTIDAGRRINDAVRANLGASVHAWVGGLSNGYILYVTTPEEYRYLGVGGGCQLATDGRLRQTYEAASTLYGPNTLPFLTEKFDTLSRAMKAQGLAFAGVDEASGTYAAGPSRSRLPVPTTKHTTARPVSVCALDATTACFRWLDDGPGDAPLSEGAWVSVKAQQATFDDDLGYHFVTRALASEGGATEWATLWRLPVSERLAIGAADLALHFSVGRTTRAESDSFPLGSGPPPCTAAEQAACGAFEDPTDGGPLPLPTDCR